MAGEAPPPSAAAADPSQPGPSTTQAPAAPRARGKKAGGGGEKSKAPSRGSFNCPDCGKPFSRREYVVRHQRLKHLGQRDYTCESCGNAFARSDLLSRHYKSCKGPSADDLPHKEPRRSGSTSATSANNDDEADSPADGRERDLACDQTYATGYPGQSVTAHDPTIFVPPSILDSSSNHGSNTSISPLTSFSPMTVSSASSSGDVNSPEEPMSYSEHVLSNALLASAYGGAGAGGRDTSLAPALSTSDRAGFTQDEILASEVLEDLLRSPGFPPRTTSSSDFNNSLTTSLSPWHGSSLSPVLTSGPGNSSVSVVGSSGFPTNWPLVPAEDPGENGIEFSDAAIQLADYFNQGGVGGITALDLGFTYQPSLFHDELYEPNPYHVDNDKFFLPEQKLCLGYLYPWHVPPLQKLSQFAAVAADKFLPSVPLIHPASFKLAEMPTHTAFALTVTGAAYKPDGVQFSNDMLIEKRVYLVRDFNKKDSVEEEQFASLQSMLLYQLLGLFHRDETQRLLAHTFHGALVMMARQLDLPSKIQQTYLVDPHPGLEGEVLDAIWKQWVKVETWRRVAFIVYLSDLEAATRFKSAPLLPFSDLAVDLPAPDALWNAKSATEWLRLRLSPSTPRAIPFLDAIRVLLSPNPPLPFSPQSDLLASLSRLGSLSLLILARTLSFLQMKTEEAIAVSDPFRNIFSVVGLFENREREHRDVLGRIKRGRETLKSLPGGVKRGGGEQWFENVLPNDGNVGGSVEELSANARAQRERNKDTQHFERRIQQTVESLGPQYPDFMDLEWMNTSST